jgi:hypothetical protein
VHFLLGSSFFNSAHSLAFAAFDKEQQQQKVNHENWRELEERFDQVNQIQEHPRKPMPGPRLPCTIYFGATRM